MTLLDKITEKVLAQIDDTGFTQSGAFNLRHNGIALCHGDSEHIKIKKKQDKPGIDIFIDGKTDGEEVHIPVVVDASGMTDVVYNDFYVAEGANVPSLPDVVSTTADVTKVAMMVFILSMWKKMQMYAM